MSCAFREGGDESALMVEAGREEELSSNIPFFPGRINLHALPPEHSH